jgi:hypothetical protein
MEELTPTPLNRTLRRKCNADYRPRAPFDRAILALDPAKTGHDDQRLTASERVCQAVPAPGSKVTLSALARAGSGA